MPSLLKRFQRRFSLTRTKPDETSSASSNHKASPNKQTDGGPDDDNDSVDITALITDENNSHQVVLWTKDYCPYCQIAQDLLTREMKGLDVAVHNLSKAPQGQLVLQELERQTGRTTVPNIFIHGKPIGGNSELQELYHSDQLEILLFPGFHDQKYRAVWKGTVLAETETPVIVRGFSYYFPPESIRRKYFHESNDTSVCGWKGQASYFDVRVKGKRYKNAAWCYKDPTEEAFHFKDYLSFDENVVVMKGREIQRTKL